MADSNTAAVRKVLWIELCFNILVALSKGIYGLLIGSFAILADAVHSTLDGATNIIVLVVLHFAAAPPDQHHPYGHRKFEVIASAVVGLAVGATGVRLGWDAISRLGSEPKLPATSVAGFVVLGAGLLINVFVTVYEARRARALRSTILAADAAHTGSDVLVTLTVIGSFAASHAGVVWADAVGTLVVIVVILKVAWSILAQSLGVLADRAPLDADRVVEIAMSVEGVRECHRVRSHGPAAAVYVDLHLLFDGNLPLRQAHELAHKVEEQLREHLPEVSDVTIHIEPCDSAADTLQ